MKVLHVITSLEGGAGLCTARIHKALIRIGVDSKILYAYGRPALEGVEGTVAERDRVFWYSNPLRGKVKHLLNKMPWYWDNEKADILLNKQLKKVKDRPYVHHPFSNFKNITHHTLVEWADIIHLHWVTGFIDYPIFFNEVKKPIVWTLHDMHPSRGLMHFYSPYSKIPDELKHIDDLCCKIKRKAVKKSKSLYVVAISEMMKDEICSSGILSAFPCTLIHNGVDTTIFKPIAEKKKGNLFLFSSYDIWDKRKGLSRVIEALEMVDVPNKSLMVVGNNGSKVSPTASFPIIECGWIDSQIELSDLYSQADYFISASYEEAFPQTPLEAMACGTPVISTPCSGAADLIRPFNGVICDGYDAKAIVEGILKAQTLEFDSNIIRQYIIDNYEYSIIAEQYNMLYKSILRK